MDLSLFYYYFYFYQKKRFVYKTRTLSTPTSFVDFCAVLSIKAINDRHRKTFPGERSGHKQKIKQLVVTDFKTKYFKNKNIKLQLLL